VEVPAQVDTRELKKRAREMSILIESGDICFMQDNPPQNFFRLGYSSITANRIEPGIKLLADLIHKML
jgi:GntR family transcriptional regulator/MocR family aminotransferase